MAAVTTCQVCARPIKAKTGVIAHHGYQRPGGGWQTASCFGARYRPFEVACDALPPAIEAATRHLNLRRDELANLMELPPAELRFQERDAYGHARGAEIVRAKPEDFDPTKRPASGRMGVWQQYSCLFFRRVDALRKDINGTQATVDFFQKRLASWVAPVASASEVCPCGDPACAADDCIHAVEAEAALLDAEEDRNDRAEHEARTEQER